MRSTKVASKPLYHLPGLWSERTKAKKPPIHASSDKYILNAIVPAKLVQGVELKIATDKQ